MKETQSDIMFTISLEDYRVMAKHGAYDFEHLEDQPFIVTIKVQITDGKVNDNLDKTVNYADLQSTIDDILIDSKPIRLMETMAEKNDRQIEIKFSYQKDIDSYRKTRCTSTAQRRIGRS